MSEPDDSVSGKLNTSRLVIAALIILAVGAGVYVTFGLSGKPEQVAGGCAISDTLKASLNSKAEGEVAAFTVTDKPVSVADISFKDDRGNAKVLDDWSGRTVLLNLWATWCAPCRREMPALDALERDLGGEQFQVVPISLDLGTDEKPKAFYEEIGLKHLPFMHDGSLESLNRLKKLGLAYGLPATLLIDKNGCVLGTLNGPAEWSGEDAKALIRAAF